MVFNPINWGLHEDAIGLLSVLLSPSDDNFSVGRQKINMVSFSCNFTKQLWPWDVEWGKNRPLT